MRVAILAHVENCAEQQCGSWRREGLKTTGWCAAGAPEKGGRRGGMNDVNWQCWNHVRRRVGNSRSRAHDCKGWLQSLAGATRGALHSSVHRHGLWLFRVLAAVVALDRPDGIEGLSRYVAVAGTLHHHLRLEGGQSWLDVHAVLRAARRFGRDLGRLA